MTTLTINYFHGSVGHFNFTITRDDGSSETFGKNLDPGFLNSITRFDLPLVQLDGNVQSEDSKLDPDSDVHVGLLNTYNSDPIPVSNADVGRIIDYVINNSGKPIGDYDIIGENCADATNDVLGIIGYDGDVADLSYSNQDSSDLNNTLGGIANQRGSSGAIEYARAKHSQLLSQKVIGDAVDSAIDTLANGAAETADAVADALANAAQEATDLAQDFGDYLTEELSRQERIFSELADSVGTEVREWLGDTQRDIANQIDALGNIARDAWDDFSQGVSDFLGETSPFWPFDGPGGNPLDPSNWRDPLILDLDGDGVELIAQTVSNAYFDFDQDGFAEKSGWVSGDDGMLVVDRNGDGQINDISELVGSGFVSPSTSLNPQNDGPTGFADLATYDTNGDGVVSSADSAWADLLVWRDFNGDGVTDDGELQGLDATGVASIDLAHTNLVADPQNALDFGATGNVITQQGSFTKTDGTTATVGDAWLTYNPTDTRYSGQVTIDWEVVGLPFLPGAGELKNTVYAMSEDPLLKEMAQDLQATTLTDAHQLASKVEAFILRWAGVDGVAVQSRGQHTNGAYLAAMEKFMGHEFRQLGTNANPYVAAGSTMMGNFKQLQASVMRQILPQIPLGQELMPELSPGYASQATLDATATLAPMLARMEANVPADAGEAVAYWNTMTMLVHGVKDQLPQTDAEIAAAFTASFDAQGLGLDYDQVRSAFIGGAGDDVVVGSSGADIYLFGYGSGHDQIREAMSGNNWVHGDQLAFNAVRFLPGFMAKQAAKCGACVAQL